MTITSREMPDGGYRHTCFICGYRWLSDATAETQCPKCSRQRAPTTRRLASLARGEVDRVDSRSATSDEHTLASPDGLEIDESNHDIAARAGNRATAAERANLPGNSDDESDTDDSRRHSGSDRSLPVVRV